MTWREIALETVMLPTVDQSLPNLNHRTLVVLLLMIGGVGCVVELTGASIILPRLVLFASVLAFGVVYAVRRARTLGLAPSLQGWHV